MPFPQVNRIFEFLSPVTTIRAIVTTVWKPIGIMLQQLFGIPRKIGSICSVCIRLAINPFMCILEVVKGPSSSIQQAPSLPYLLTGFHEPSSQQVSNGVRALHNSAVNTIINQISENNKLQEYRNELKKWREEKDREIVDLFHLDEKDKITMKTLALAVRKLRVLKAKKTKYAKLNNEKMKKVINKDNFNTEDAKFLQDSTKYLNDIESEMSKNKMECLDKVKTTDRLSQLFTKVLLQNESFYDFSLDSDIPVSSVNKLRSIAYRSQQENDAVNSSLKITNEKLDKILNVTEKISTTLASIEEMPDMFSLKNELAALRSQLEQEQLVLKNVKGERDFMKVKLDALEDLIEDQEDFLNSLGHRDEMEAAGQ